MATALPDLELVQRPLYSFAEADYLAGVSQGTTRRWLSGYAYWTNTGLPRVQPPVTVGAEDLGAVSFLDLVEVLAIGGLKSIGFSLPRIREIVINCQQLLEVERPRAALRFRTDGREIFVDQGAVLLEVGRRKGERA